MKLAIVGGRDYADYDNFRRIVDEYIDKHGVPAVIISGGATGVDTFAEQYAYENDIPIDAFLPDWYKNGKYDSEAGKIRNTDIIMNSTHVLALPTDKSRGTYDSIIKAKNMGKMLTVIKV